MMPEQVQHDHAKYVQGCFRFDARPRRDPRGDRGRDESPNPFEVIREALDNIGPCDTEAENPHREVWCIAHQQKRCTAEADAAAARRVLATLEQQMGEAREFIVGEAAKQYGCCGGPGRCVHDRARAWLAAQPTEETR